MNVAFMRQWIAALRSDDYVQVPFALYLGQEPDGRKRMCLMGVGYDVFGARWNLANGYYWPSIGTDIDLPDLRELYGLIRRNNTGESFASLANDLEKLVDEYEGKLAQVSPAMKLAA